MLMNPPIKELQERSMKKVIVKRKQYRTPKLIVYGNITDLTQAGDPGFGDSVKPTGTSGMGG